MQARIFDHPKKYEFRDLSQPTRLMAHCQFRKNRIFPKRYCPVNDAAYALRNMLTDGLDVYEHQLQRAKQFADIEIVS